MRFLIRGDRIRSLRRCDGFAVSGSRIVWKEKIIFDAKAPGRREIPASQALSLCVAKSLLLMQFMLYLLVQRKDVFDGLFQLIRNLL